MAKPTSESSCHIVALFNLSVISVQNSFFDGAPAYKLATVTEVIRRLAAPILHEYSIENPNKL